MLTLVEIYEALTIQSYHKKLAPHVKEVEQAASAFFRKQGLAFGRLVDQAFVLQEAQIDPTVDRSLETLPKLDIGALAKAIAECYVLGNVDASAEHSLGISFDLKNPRAVEYIQQHGVELLKELNTTTKADIKAIIENGVKNGLSPQNVAKAIKAQFVDYAKPSKGSGKRSRALMVAVTEAGRAYQAGNYDAIKEATGTGLDFEKSWLPVKKPCPICQANADQGWIGFQEAHASGALYPPSHPNCRCAELYQREKSKPVTNVVKPPRAPRARKQAPSAPTPSVAPVAPQKPVQTRTRVAKGASAQAPVTATSKQTFDFHNDDHYIAINNELEKIFPKTSSYWNKKIKRAVINANGLYDRSNGDVWMNSNSIQAQQQHNKDATFKTAVHELIHARSKGIRDFNIEGVGWEEAVVEANAQLYAEKIGKTVGYHSPQFSKHFNEHPYKAKWIDPLDNTLKDLKIDRTQFYTDMMTQTCDERKAYIKAALVKKYGKEEGRNKFLALNRTMQ